MKPSSLVSTLLTDTVFFLRDCCTLWYSAADSVVLSLWAQSCGEWVPQAVVATLPLWPCRAALRAPSLQLSRGCWTWCSFASLPDILGVLHGSEHPLPSHSPGTQMLVNITFRGKSKPEKKIEPIGVSHCFMSTEL